MKSINVFRLENSNRIGPFRGGHRDEANLLKEHLGIKQSLVELGNMKPRLFKKLSKSGWLCAWSSEVDFDNWMNGQSEFFEALGYFKVCYAVNSYKLCFNQNITEYNKNSENIEYSHAQVFFNPNKATIIKKIQ